MATFTNTSGKRAQFSVGTVPGAKPTVYDVAPGESCELAEGYADYVRQYGLIVQDATSRPAPIPDSPESVVTRASRAAIKEASGDAEPRKRQRGKK